MTSIVRIENSSSSPFRGWVRCNIDWEPPAPTGYLTSGGRWAVGRQTGLDTRILDLHVELAAGETKVVMLPETPTQPWEMQPLASFDIIAAVGGLPRITGGPPMELVSLIADGAGYLSHWTARIGPMLVVKLWCIWYPDQPWLANGEVVVVASNPHVPDLTTTAPNVRIEFGDALVLLPMRGLGPIVAAGTQFGDGQGRGTPVTFLWVRHCRDAMDFASVGAVMNGGVRAVGIKRLLPDGNPLFPANFDPHQWAAQRFGNALRKLSTWEEPVCGPTKQSTVTGAQEEQLFHPGGEAMLPSGVAAATVRYLAALHLYLMRPCHHLEADGSPLNVDAHPNLKFWDSRPHWHAGVSPDQLGKPRSLTVAEANNAWGEDTQHALFGTLFGAARLTGSPALQWLLRHRANAYLLQRTLTGPTAGVWSAREVGYECLFAVQCHLNMEDRAMAARVVDRWRRRMQQIVLPMVASRDYIAAELDHWGPGYWYAPWQESLAAYGIDLSCRLLGGVPGGEAAALRIAKRAMADGWVTDGITWRTRPLFPVLTDDASATNEERPEWTLPVRDEMFPNYMAEDATLEAGLPPATHDFDRFGMPLCAFTVLRQEPTNATARAIWTYLLSDPNGARNWMPPGVNP